MSASEKNINPGNKEDKEESAASLATKPELNKRAESFECLNRYVDTTHMHAAADTIAAECSSSSSRQLRKSTCEFVGCGVSVCPPTKPVMSDGLVLQFNWTVQFNLIDQFNYETSNIYINYTIKFNSTNSFELNSIQQTNSKDYISLIKLIKFNNSIH